MFMMPDMDNNIEMRIVVALASGAVRTPDTFVMFLLLFVCYVVVRVGIEIAIYLFRLYRERAFTPSPHMQNFRILLGTGLVVLLVSSLLGVVAIGFALFCVASTGYDWYIGRSEKQEIPEIEHATYDDIIGWQNQVNAAYDADLIQRN